MSGPLATSGGRGGAPIDAQYVVLVADATLTVERVLTAGTGITLVDGGAGGAITVSVQNLYLRLDATNDPVTAGLEVNAATTAEPVLILQTADDNVANHLLDLRETTPNKGYLIELNGERFIHRAVGAYSTYNLFIGTNAGNLTVNPATAFSNVGIGQNALLSLTTGAMNVCIGESAGRAMTTGNRNICLGRSTGRALIGGSGNLLIGDEAGTAVTSGSQNVCIGGGAGLKVTTGLDNFFLGYRAGAACTTGSANVVIGTWALPALVTGTATIAIGCYAFETTTAGENMAIGYMAGRYLTTGQYNVYIGNQAGYRSQTGSGNTLIGCGAGLGVAANSYSNNTLIGRNTGFALTTGSNNVLIGYQAGDLITSGASNIIIGYDIDPTGAAVSSELNIGALIYGNLSAKTAGVNVTPPNLAAAWHVDQATDDAAIPVLLLDQADVDQEMIEFVSTIGVGNAIEAVGGKTLTVTHFIKVMLPGGLTRYFPVGTIA